MRKRDRNVALGTFIAAGVGYVAGLLTAPKSGRETRKDIQKQTIKAKKEAEKDHKKLHNELTKLIDAGKDKAKKLKDTSKAEFDEALERAQAARQKVGEILSSIHEGEAEDKDLDKAVADVNEAIQHLKDYVKKTNKS